jgi:hypothetical protein
MTTLDHMPFTCPYTPGKANLKLWWWVYLLGFTNYAYSMTQLEQRLLRSPRLFVLFFLVSVVLLWAIARSRRRRIDKIFALRFDSAGLEAPEPLGLSYRPF